MSAEGYVALFMSIAFTIAVVVIVFLVIELLKKRDQLEKTQRDLIDLADEFYRRKQDR